MIIRVNSCQDSFLQWTHRWDAPLVHLPDRNALHIYLQGRQLSQTTIERALRYVKTPLILTKRGAIFYAHKRL